MILNDIIEEYEFVYDTLKPCNDYFQQADVLITQYFSKISSATSKYFKANSSSDTYRNALVSELASGISSAFNQITTLITLSYEFYGSLRILKTHDYKNKELQFLINDFIENSQKSISATNSIIKAQLQGMKTEELLTDLIEPLQTTIKDYHTLVNLYSQFNTAGTLLLESLPEHIQDSTDYSDISIGSSTKSDSFEDITSSISEFGNIVELIGRIKNADVSDRYYIRKIETGSLVIVITGTTISIVAIIKFIDFCFKKYVEYRKALLEIKTMKQEVLKNDLEVIKQLLEISSDASECNELIERATESAFNYFKRNPIFKLNEILYDTGEKIKLLNSNKE